MAHNSRVCTSYGDQRESRNQGIGKDWSGEERESTMLLVFGEKREREGESVNGRALPCF